MDRDRLLLIDANSLANRAYYALPPLSTGQGVPTGAVYGFLTMLFRFIDERKPGYIACAFDHPSPTFRHTEFGEYKATRKPAPEDFKTQIPLLKDVLKALNIKYIEVPGFEADDIIATLAERFKKQGFSVTILSGDRDCLQLVEDRVTAILPVRGITVVREYDRETVKKDLGIWPHQIPDFKGLAGDSSDNIPGVKGIGEKTAVSLLEQYGSLEAVYENLPGVTPTRVRELLSDAKDTALLSKKLATVTRQVPIEISAEDLFWTGPDVEKAREVLSALEFHSLVKRLKPAVTESESEPSVPEVGSASSAETGIVTVDSEEKLKDLCDKIAASGRVSIYASVTEITRDFLWPDLVGVSPGKGAYLISFPEGTLDRQELLWKYLGPILVDPKVEKLGFNQKWLYTLCFKRGLTLKGLSFDIMVAAYLLDPTRTTYRLEDIVKNYAGIDIFLPPAGHPRTLEEAVEYRRALGRHLAQGAWASFKVVEGIQRELEEKGLSRLACEVEFPLIEVLASMEAIGIGVDLETGRQLRASFSRELMDIEKSIFLMAGETFNLGSTKQLAHILFEKLKLPPVKKTKTGYSTDAEVLEILSEQHDLPRKILEYRTYAKLKSTYLDVLEEVVNPTTGRIHSTFHQTVTATGRLSSSEPNLQNIPVRGELGKSIRRVFVPAPGRLFLASDYSQIELRVMAHFSEDPSLIDAFRRGEDIHARTASEIFGVPLEQVTPDLRSRAKAVNFGVIYGISDYGLARNTGVSREEARKFIEAYFARYPGVKRYMDEQIERARKDGYVTTILGRRRPIPDIDSRIKKNRGFAERTAINTPIQGSAADIIKLAMVKIYRRIRDEGLISRMILQVHDELIFEIVPEEEEYMRKLVKEEMEGVMELRVPLEVEIGTGKSWYEV